MFNIVMGAVIGIMTCTICTSNKINDLCVENYYLLRKLEELQKKNEFANKANGEKHDK